MRLAQDESNNIPNTDRETDTINPQTHPIIELTTDEFPTLAGAKALPENHTQDSPTIDEFSYVSMDPSPAVITAKPMQNNFKRPRETTSDSEDVAKQTAINNV